MFVNTNFARKVHRSGWVDACSAIADITTDVIIDVYVDATFGWKNKPAYTSPWVGVVHHTCQGPNNINELVKKDAFVESLPHCKGLFTLSKYLSAKLSELLPNIDVFSLTHPTVQPNLLYDRRWIDAIEPVSLIHVGNWNRDIQYFVDYKAPRGFEKKILNGPVKSFTDKGITNLGNLNDDDYDDLLTRCVVFIRLFDASAVNTIIECIVRNTPVYVNRLPAVVEYLGEDYPLYHENVPVITVEACKAATEYLSNHPKHVLRHDAFRREFCDTLNYLKIDFSSKRSRVSKNVYGSYMYGAGDDPFAPIGPLINPPVDSSLSYSAPYQTGRGHNYY